MRIISFPAGEQCLHGEIGWDDETRRVDQELAGNIKEDEEEVQGAETEDHVDFWDAGLLLKVVESWVFGQFSVGGSVGSHRKVWERVLRLTCRAVRGGIVRCDDACQYSPYLFFLTDVFVLLPLLHASLGVAGHVGVGLEGLSVRCRRCGSCEVVE